MRLKYLTSAAFPCKIDKAVTPQPLCTRSSGDRAFGSGPKGRRFESCRVQKRRYLGYRPFFIFSYLYVSVFLSARANASGNLFMMAYAISYCSGMSRCSFLEKLKISFSGALTKTYYQHYNGNGNNFTFCNGDDVKKVGKAEK